MRTRLTAGTNRSAITANTLQKTTETRFVADYPLASLTPSEANTRRKRLDVANATAETAKELAIKDGETTQELVARLEDHAAKQTSEDAQQVWNRLASLAGAIHSMGHLIQPIVALNDGTIVAGERRWLASQLAGFTHVSVNLRKMDPAQERLARFLENENRDNLLAHETVAGVRDVVFGMVESPKEITGARMAEIFGAGKTRSAMYAAFCHLPEGDPVLKELVSGRVTTLRDCYTMASQRLSDLRHGRESEPVAPPAPKPAPAPAAAKGPSIKVALPVDDRTRTFLLKLSDTQLVPQQHRERFDELTDRWPNLSNKERSSELTELMTVLIEALD